MKRDALEGSGGGGIAQGGDELDRRGYRIGASGVPGRFRAASGESAAAFAKMGGRVAGPIGTVLGPSSHPVCGHAFR